MTTNAFDAVVIGAGIAGLTAARDLCQRGFTVALLEARDRPGGRVFSDQPTGWPAPIEQGAEFIHGGEKNFTTLLGAAGLKKVPVPTANWQHNHGKLVRADDVWDRIDATLKKIGPKFRGSFARWLYEQGDKLSAADRSLIEGFVEGFHAGTEERISAQTLYRAAAAGGDDQQRPDGPYTKIVEELSHQISSRGGHWHFGRCAKTITWTARGVQIETTTRAIFEARVAIITLPLGVLRASPAEKAAVLFKPPLVEKQACWEELSPGHALRLLVRLRDDAWSSPLLPAKLRKNRGRDFGFLRSRQPAFPVWWSLAPSPILVGWSGGPDAQELALLSDEEIFLQGLRALASILGQTPAALRELVLDWRLHNWSTDPYSRGAYSYTTAGSENAPNKLAEPVGKTLFFAGEATADPLDLGTVHGAFASGERAAREAARVLKPARRPRQPR